MNLPASITQHLNEADKRLEHHPKLQQLYRNCFPNTLETTTKLLDDGTTFVFTGDIPAMWLRDSTEQVRHYIPFAKDDPELRRILRGLIARQMFYVNIDPYTNAFNETANDRHYMATDDCNLSPWMWERKYELDSLCFVVLLAYMYWKETEDASIFDDACYQALTSIVHVIRTEQRHAEQSPYHFIRQTDKDTETLQNNGRGMPVNYTGMSWSGFRPSDDSCEFGYNIPSNMFAVVILGHIQDIMSEVYRDERLAASAAKLRKEIDFGIRTYGIVDHPKYGKIYAYETDGYGNYSLMDDAGTPGLLSIPYIGYTDNSDPIYQNTRRFALSFDNPFYFEGQYAKGIGSPHTPGGYVWHMALSMQALTADNDEEIKMLIDMLIATDADTGYMHEGFHPDDPTDFSREWFAWSNSLFASLIKMAMDKGLV
ncbi:MULTISPECIES: glycoside hydrolase family 125 protein [Paenibacillus]|uniref:Metal-independent alpha-mannosidase n=1 Tax=Paenibacillus campinasensis TaxID=66347 RepID=A0ABW9T3Y6_9BACL|nr:MULTISPECIES: glycoside hydrolase family 125 protein [Paenibacillus]MUG66830.1 metal-independent alpha-mannosidase [Paenibacillus campinasensis]PAK55847.1 metal-independent alpha-mannosidase [Paenibacillus sp. 7541]